MLAELRRGDKKANLIKVDCSNYSEGHEVAALIGSPPGYVGHDIEPIFSKKRVEKKGTVILFDEIEKGHQKLYNLMLQIMDDGELQLSRGGTVSFRNTMIIMTSNLGAKEMAAELSDTPLGFAAKQRGVSYSVLDSVATKKFEEHFTPEFINRLNKTVVFHPLTAEGLGKVLDTKVARVNDAYGDYFGVNISLSDTARSKLVESASQNPQLGARPLVRVFEDSIQTTLGQYVGTGKVVENTHVRVFDPSEVPESVNHYEPQDEGSFIFASKVDPSIKSVNGMDVLPFDL